MVKRFSKTIVLLVLALNIAFAIAVFYVFLKTGSEPSALVGAWFAFTTVELWSLAKIKMSESEDSEDDEDSQEDIYEEEVERW